MNGAYGNNDPELRPPGIKASLRFWWRALNGHLLLSDLRQQEGEIFGNTKGRSKVIIRVEETEESYVNIPLLAHRSGKDERETKRMQTWSDAIAKNISFRIRIDCKANQREMIKNLFILSCTLGGLGKRSRRGFGSVAVIAVEINGEKDTDFKMPDTIDEIYKLLPKAYFENAKNTIYSNFERNEPYPYLISIEIGEKGFSSERELLERIGSSSSKSKRENNDSWDYRNSLGHTSKRMASPFYVSVVCVGNTFYPIFTSLNIATEKGNNVPRNLLDIHSAFKNRIK
jgi:CRISPR-associated protein Cmr1